MCAPQVACVYLAQLRSQHQYQSVAKPLHLDQYQPYIAFLIQNFLPLPSSLLPAPCSLLPKTQEESTSPK
ncbi:MAG: hypothetical protein F6J94_04085 [Moorea sp. SIO1F2]|uniref:hypothetical protein n=1 Tax=unclassified Moorena TaxID=2683338 RepID=UPI0013BC1C79|nr:MULTISPECIES: hypothetical protein [unclassified Moorena]NEN96176.1 hypothetical protein [Moorena sp. SIO3I7]NEO05164.1 hypothetical protein [Moorena sp. SIO3I8]NEO21992.1 hypothetical protein [Moorena sp. SIO4A5]NEP21814.1 hypothetical protein [Moorena sp. SIO3I6]NEQ61320.1 hypothetical protein [Moorena sp. SIO4A1]